MIPEFPTFKKIELSDKKDVEKFTHQYPPYSDFNFTSMWSWDVEGKMQISELNNNLVVKFCDYITGEPFYSFLGKNKANETAKTLLKLSIKEGLDPVLKLLPNDSVSEINDHTLIVKEDRDHHDYIIPTSLFKNYNTKKTRNKKNSVKQFLGKFHPKKIKLDMSNTETRNSIYSLFEKWSLKKEDPLKVENELCALKRFIEHCSNDYHICTGVFIEDRMVGFCLSEILNDKFASVHFCKADTSISPGIYAYLLQENAQFLIEEEREWVNIEQDLGMPNIRQWKMSHGVDMFLKKYIIEYNTLGNM